jgi:D-3-phosphoglycerate dehydrogenase
MKLLSLSDSYINAEDMQRGLAPLASLGIEIENRHWHHPNLVEITRDNLAIEKGGPEAVALPPELCAGLAEFDIVITQFAPISRWFLEAARKLKVLASLRSGMENVDMAFATSQGVTVMNTPGRLSRAVAEFTVAMILAEMRNVGRSHARLVRGVWDRSFPNSSDIPELYHRTIGLVGYGAVGQMVAGFLRGFECRILAYDPFFKGDPGTTRMTDLPTLMKESDVVSLHARMSQETMNLIGAAELALMKPSAILVNTARSRLIHEPSLIRTLQEHRIMGAALDVFDDEPLPPDHPFTKMDNVTLTTHLAGSTRDAFRNTPGLMAGHLTRMLRGEKNLPVLNGVQPTLRAAQA